MPDNSFQLDIKVCSIEYPGQDTEAEFFDVIGTIESPFPPSKSGLKLVYNVNIVYENLKSENS